MDANPQQSQANAPALAPMAGSALDCNGYRKLLAQTEEQETKWKDDRPRKAMEWAVARAKHYAEKTGLTAEAVLDAWEDRRTYWHVNYYQEANMPEIKGENVRVFETSDDLHASTGDRGFRCPACNQVSRSPYECDSGAFRKNSDKVCDWKAYGLLGCLGKGVSVFVKEKVRVETFFQPVAWEQNAGALPTEGADGG